MENKLILIALLLVCIPVAIGANTMYQKNIQLDNFNGVTAKVMTQERIQILEQAMLKVQNQSRTNINNLQNTIITERGENYLIKGQVQSKFMNMFTVKRTLKYEINNDGEVTRLRNRFIDWFFPKVD